jgi:3-hydroxyisobutyrate dehydrogenase-like beta-hydroxyacid dehydrogenase
VTDRKVGVVGLGNMGGGIARNFQKAGVPLMVWDVAPAARAAFSAMAGVDIAPPGEMAVACTAIFFVVPATPEIASCLDGKDGVMARAARGLVVYDFTTSDPVATRARAARAAAPRAPMPER